MTQPTSVETLLAFASDAAWQAGQLTLAHFRPGVEVEWKPDASPVTVADRAAEQLLRGLIEQRFPHHAIIGEELGESDRDSSHRWFIDPIDGTQSFIRGVPLYGVLIGLEIGGEMVVGVACFPALGEILAAGTGVGCRWNDRVVRVSSVSRLEEAVLVYTDARDLARLRPTEWTRLTAMTRVQRGWGDCYGHCLVATGRAEVMLDPVMSPWDCAALLPILREAGGTFSDWGGCVTVHGGNAVSTNGVLFDQVMAALGPARSAPS